MSDIVDLFIGGNDFDGDFSGLTLVAYPDSDDESDNEDVDDKLGGELIQNDDILNSIIDDTDETKTDLNNLID